MMSLLICLMTAATAVPITTVELIPGEHADAIEQRYARLLADRLGEIPSLAIVEPGGNADLTIYLGTAESHSGLPTIAAQLGLPMPTTWDPGREGYVLASGTVRAKPIK